MADSVVGGVPDAGDSSFEVDLGPMQPQCLTAPAAGQSQEGVERAVTVFATCFEERVRDPSTDRAVLRISCARPRRISTSGFVGSVQDEDLLSRSSQRWRAATHGRPAG
jgi:hypothetical protein